MIYDITPLLSSRIQVWPGDTPLSREVLLDMKRGANLTLSSIRSTVHLGAHADAPSHYGADAPSIEKRSLDLYLGPCQVIRVTAPYGIGIRPELVVAPVRAERVLFATGTFPDPENFNEDFAAFTPDLIEHLHRQEVRLVGIDTPSVDLFHSRDLPCHMACLRHDIAILEGITLKEVPAGLYELIALPLRLEGFEASPVRAVLRTLP
jgi:arylformamidase